ncbi:MAG: MraY family glycosyltransferase [Planctomycetota bacterium]
MAWWCLATAAIGIGIAAPVAWALAASSRKLGWTDRAGQEAHKLDARQVPNTGGLALGLGFALPAGLVVALGPALAGHLPLHDGARELLHNLANVRAEALALLGAWVALFAVGWIDDRKGLGPWTKLAVQLAAAATVVTVGQTRALTALDQWSAMGMAVSIALSMAWIVVITNAMNFMDNMDGLTGGVGAVAAIAFAVAAGIAGQWWVALVASLLAGATLGVLALNAPPAKLFFGDSGALPLGLTLAWLAMRLTYFDSEGAGDASARWYALLAPMLILAVPLYDAASVTLVRLRAGKSPLVGDHNHLSHRLVRLGLSKRRAVGVIVCLAVATAGGGVMIGSLDPWQAWVVGGQAFAALLALAILEHGAHRSPRGRRDDGPPPAA